MQEGDTTMMKYSIVRAFASGGLLIGLGMLMIGCNSDNSKTSIGAARDPVTGETSLPTAPQNVTFETVKDPPITADTRFAAGQLAETRGMNDEAIKQYNLALRLNPRHQPTLFRLAVLETALKEYPQAIQTWKQYVVATNESAAAYANLGFCYELAGENNEAEAAYQRGISRDPTEQTCHVNYGLLLAAAGQIQEALEQFQAVLSPAEAHYNIGSVYEQQGHKEDAKVEYRKALALDPNLSDAQKRLDAMKAGS
jgi:tetratricopeptide (TPR) repeat protein